MTSKMETWLRSLRGYPKSNLVFVVSVRMRSVFTPPSFFRKVKVFLIHALGITQGARRQ